MVVNKGFLTQRANNCGTGQALLQEIHNLDFQFTERKNRVVTLKDKSPRFVDSQHDASSSLGVPSFTQSSNFNGRYAAKDQRRQQMRYNLLSEGTSRGGRNKRKQSTASQISNGGT